MGCAGPGRRPIFRIFRPRGVARGVYLPYNKGVDSTINREALKRNLSRWPVGTRVGPVENPGTVVRGHVGQWVAVLRDGQVHTTRHLGRNLEALEQ